MATRQEYEKVYITSILFAVVILIANLYYFCHPILSVAGLTFAPLDYLMQMLRHGGVFSNPLKTKFFVILLLGLCSVVRSGKGAKVEPAIHISVGLLSLLLFLFPLINPVQYMLMTIFGTIGLVWTFAMLGRLFSGFHEHDNDLRESFEQESAPIDGPWAINLPTKYYYKKQWHNGIIPVGNPFRGILVVGSAGSGKSFSVFIPLIEQMIAKGFSMMLYDFKMPDLTKVVYNALLRNKDKYKIKPQFYCINFKDPVKSNRCNPLDPMYLADIIDASETARVIMDALNKGNEKKDFFFMSAQQYIGICIWLLRIYTPPGGKMGDWCDIPHLIELINQDYTKVLQIVKKQPTLDGKARVFIDAYDANAQDQLQGQIASARIPLNDIASPVLYWVLSGNDFNLDLNDPEEPKILCIGNDPDRQQVYGAALSLFTFRIIKRVNRPGRVPCSIVLDELPTLMVEGLANLMATARSNLVNVTMGIQDLSQIIAEYNEKEAEKILGLPANVFVGASSVKTAEKYSKEFGREFRRQESQTRNIDSESVSISYHEEEIMPIRKITSLPQGTFIGKVAVENNSTVKQPFFCGAIQIDMEEYKRKKAQEQDIPDLADFQLGDLWKTVSVPEIGSIYITEWLERTVEKQWHKEHRYSYSKEDLDAEVSRRLSLMSDDECTKVLQSLMPEIERKEINRIIEDNFYAIKGDIKQLIELECQTDEEEEEYEAEEKTSVPVNPAVSENGEDDDDKKMREVLSKGLEDVGLSVRTSAALIAAGYATIADIAIRSREKISHTKLIGKTSMGEIDTLLKSYSLDWEMDLSRYGYELKDNA